MTIRLAMWSGPRTISTAMMRSWENRPDCTVVDEPFYACYLAETGLDHPARDEILASQSSDRAEVIRQLTEHDPGAEYFYQKHMTHHVHRGMDMGWCAGLRHCFLIRDPAELIASYLGMMPRVSEDAIGIVRQRELFREIETITGVRPAVVDSTDVLRNPAGVLERLCEALDAPFTEAMLRWPKGPRDSDGVWAPHWYKGVEASTGFAPYTPRRPQLAEEHRDLARRMGAVYEELARFRIRAD